MSGPEQEPPGGNQAGEEGSDAEQPDQTPDAAEQLEFDTKSAPVRLDDVLKRTGLVGTGGEAKVLIQAGEVTVNGEVETRRRKQLSVGDVIEFLGQRIEID